MTRLSFLAALVVGLASLTGCADSLVGEADLAADGPAIAATGPSLLPAAAQSSSAECTEKTFTIDGPMVLTPGALGSFVLNPNAGVCDVNEVTWTVTGNATIVTSDDPDADPLVVTVQAGDVYGGPFTLTANVLFNEDSVVTLSKTVQVSNNTCTDATVTITGPSTLEVNDADYYSVSMPDGCEIEEVDWSVQGRAAIPSIQIGLPDEPQTTVRVKARRIPGAFTLTAEVRYNGNNTATGTLEGRTVPRDLQLSVTGMGLFNQASWSVAQRDASRATECTLDRYARRNSPYETRSEQWSVWDPPANDTEFLFKSNGPWTATYTMECTIPGRIGGSRIVVARGGPVSGNAIVSEIEA